MKKLGVGGLLLALGSCQTSYTYVPIIPNAPNLEMANAQCQMMSSSAERGMVAWGRPGYVAGAQIGNAIGNAVRVDQFMQQCMTMQGWRRVANQHTSPQPMPTKASSGLDPQKRKEAIDIFAMGYIADTCHAPLSARQKTSMAKLKDAAGAQMVDEGRALGMKTMNEGLKTKSMVEFCKEAAVIVKDSQV